MERIIIKMVTNYQVQLEQVLVTGFNPLLIDGSDLY